jgi:hypothetical protein
MKEQGLPRGNSQAVLLDKIQISTLICFIPPKVKLENQVMSHLQQGINSEDCRIAKRNGSTPQIKCANQAVAAGLSPKSYKHSWDFISK